MAFSLPEYCRLFAQKKAYQGGVTGTPGPPPLATPLPRSNIYTVLKTFSFFKVHVDEDFLFPRGLLFFAGNLVPRGNWERQAYPVQSVQWSCYNRHQVWGNATFCGQDLAICQDIWTPP